MVSGEYFPGLSCSTFESCEQSVVTSVTWSDCGLCFFDFVNLPVFFGGCTWDAGCLFPCWFCSLSLLDILVSVIQCSTSNIYVHTDIYTYILYIYIFTYIIYIYVNTHVSVYENMYATQITSIAFILLSLSLSSYSLASFFPPGKKLKLKRLKPWKLRSELSVQSRSKMDVRSKVFAAPFGRCFASLWQRANS